VRIPATIAAIGLSLALYLELAWPPFYAFPAAQPFAG